MRAADDFEAIHNRIAELQKLHLVKAQHEFDSEGWCLRCKLHKFHTPAVPVCMVEGF